MGKLNERLTALGRGLAGSVRRFPMEALLGAVYFLIVVFREWLDVKIPCDPMEVLLWFFPHYVLVFTLHRFSEGRPAVRALYYLSWFLWLPLMMIPDIERFLWPLGISYILAVILLVIGDRRMDNEPYGRNILRTAGKVATGFLVGGLLALIVSAVVASVEFLFGLDLSEKWYTYPLSFIAFVVLPLLCCILVTESPAEGKPASRFHAIAIDWILSPALVLYAFILYVYIIRILVNWTLPDGGVAYLVLSFLTVGLMCHLLRLQVEKRHFEWFYKAFPFIAAAPTVLLWVGIARRIGEYGLTESRVFLLAIAALVTAFVVMLVWKRSRNFQLMTLILAGVAVLLTVIPGIRARDFGIRSQRARLERLLPQVLNGEATVETLEFAELEKDSTRLAAFESAYGAWKYLRDEMRDDAFAERYGALGDFQAVYRKGVQDIKIPDWITLPGEVDLGEYRHFVPSTAYHYFEDDSGVVFFADESKTDTLLVCPVMERFEKNGTPEEAPYDILVYSNGRYMAVFEKIRLSGWQGARFYTGDHSLFATEATH